MSSHDDDHDVTPLNLLLPYGNQIGGALVKPPDQLDSFGAANLNNGIFQIREGIAEVFRAQRTNKWGPWYAVVLHVERYINDGSALNPGPMQHYTVGGSMKESKPQEYLKVWCRRYPDDQGVMQPDWSFIDTSYANPHRVINVDTDAKRLALVKAHDYYLISLSTWQPRRDPMPGDLVWVTFDDILNQSRGRLLDFTDPGSNPPTISNWASNMAQGAKGQFADCSQPISNLFEEDRGPQLRPPSPSELAEAQKIVDKMAPGPMVETPNNLMFTQAGPPNAKVQTVIWESMGQSSPLVYREMAPYLVALYLAARREGVHLQLTSAWRESKKDITGALLAEFLFDSTGGDTHEWVQWDGSPLTQPFKEKAKSPTRIFNKSQLTLRLQNCTPDGQELTSNCVCTPPTGRPVTKTDDPYGHMSGFAADTSSGMDSKAGGKSQEGRVSTIYRWLSLNAWKYGFIRTVGGPKSERWHWEMQLDKTPRPRVFDRIKRNHGSWDGQFNKGTSQDYFKDTYEEDIQSAARQKAYDKVQNDFKNSDGLGPVP